MSDAVAHTLDGCEVQPLGEELNPEREELLVDMDVVRERGLEIINTTAYIAITGNVHTQHVLQSTPAKDGKCCCNNAVSCVKWGQTCGPNTCPGGILTRLLLGISFFISTKLV